MGTDQQVEHVETDYLVVGAGAMGLAFIDVMLRQDPRAQIVVVDRHAAPGGHWNDAYPYVTLHQPARFYGVSSMKLGKGGNDLASLPEILAYYREAMQRYVATGRVRHEPMCSHDGDGTVTSLLNPDRRLKVHARRRVVDATYHDVRVPSVVKPRYEVGPDVALLPLNELPRLTRSFSHHVVLGSGKTGIDAILFLLDRGVAPDAITWVMPNDAWMWNRAELLPGGTMETLLHMLNDALEADSVEASFLSLEKRGIVYRFDPTVMPTKWRCATVSRPELDGLRRVKDVVRLGRVSAVDRGRIQLERGERAVPDDTLFVDCTANALAATKPTAIFADGAITLQSVFMCQQVFSAALIARLEKARLTDEQRNELLVPVPHPEQAEDMARDLMLSTENLVRVGPRLGWWLRRNRLFFGKYEAPHRLIIGGWHLVRARRRARAAGLWPA